MHCDRNAANNVLDGAVPHPMSKKWIPWQHVGGIAVYRHENVVDEEEGIGGEFMLSCTVSGTPEQCLSALTHGASTTLLGPGSTKQLPDLDSTSQVLHIQLAPPISVSHLACLCAPRHGVVRQSISTSPCGIACLLFSSLPAAAARQLLRKWQQQQRSQAMQTCWQLKQHQQQAAQQPSRLEYPSSLGSGQAARRSEKAAAHWQSKDRHYEVGEHQMQQQQHQSGYSLEAFISSALQKACSAASRLTGTFLAALWLCLSCRANGSGHTRQAAVDSGDQYSNCTMDTSSSNGSKRLRQLGCRLWWPVLVNVAGGFTMSELGSYEGESQDASSETFVSCILKVDLGGWLSAPLPSWMCCFTTWHSGYIDECLQQMMSAVLLVKQQVEQQQQEQSMVSAGQQQGVASSGSSSSNSSGRSSAASLQLHPALHGQQQQQQRCEQCGSCHTSQQHTQSAAPTSLQGLGNWPGGSSCHVADGAIANLQAAAFAAGCGQGNKAVIDQRQRLKGHKDKHPGELHLTAAGGSAAGAARDQAVQLQQSKGHVLNGHSPAGAAAEDLVGLNQQGKPLQGTCHAAWWSPLHQPEGPAPFKVRGATYLADRTKIPAGTPAYSLLAVDLVSTPTAVQHIARYLPAVRRSRAATCFVINMMVPTAGDVMNLVMTFGSNRPWPHLQQDGQSNNTNRGSSFDHALARFLHASDSERSSMFKMIPHIQTGPWLLKQTVGCTPCIVGRKLATTYYVTDRYVEIDLDVTTCKTAGYIVQSIRGLTTSLVVDLAYLLEGQNPAELPEVLIGAVRFSNIDMTATIPLDIRREVPCWSERWNETVASS